MYLIELNLQVMHCMLLLSICFSALDGNSLNASINSALSPQNQLNDLVDEHNYVHFSNMSALPPVHISATNQSMDITATSGIQAGLLSAESYREREDIDLSDESTTSTSDDSSQLIVNEPESERYIFLFCFFSLSYNEYIFLEINNYACKFKHVQPQEYLHPQ